MADETVKKLLIKLGISTSDWKVAVNDIKSQLNAINEKAKQDAAQMKASLKEQTALINQQITDQKLQIVQAKVLQEVDRAKAVWQQQQQAAIRTAIQQKILETTEAKKQGVMQLASVRASQEQIRLEQQKLRLIQQQTAMNERQARAQGGGGMLAGVGRLASNVMGGGMLGAVAGGVLTGGLVGVGVTEILEKTGELIHKLGEELLNTAGAAGQLHEQFVKLASREGQNPEELMNKMRVATRGLVGDTQLYRVSNQFMSGSLKISSDQMVHLTEMTVALARATSRGPDSVTMAMNALSRAALTGNTRMLAMAVGIDKAQLQMRGLGTGVSATAKEQMQLSMIMDAMTRRFAEVGTPMTTVKDLFSQVNHLQDAFIEDMGYSITHSKSFAQAIQTISTWLMKITPQLLDFASSIGDKLGNAFNDIVPLFTAVRNLFLSFTNTVTELFRVLKDLSPLINFEKEFGNLLGPKNELSTFQTFIEGLVIIIEGLSKTLKDSASEFKLWGTVVKSAVHGDMQGIKQAFIDAKNEIDNNTKDFITNTTDSYYRMTGISGQVDVGKAGKTPKPLPDQGVLRQEQQLKMQIAIDEAKNRLTVALQENDDEKAANKEKYESGLEDLKDYLAKEKELNTAAHNLKLQQINEDAEAKIKQLNFDAQGYKDSKGNVTPGMSSGMYQLKMQKIMSDSNDQIAAENRSVNKENIALTKEGLDDQLAAYRENVANINRVVKEGIQERLSELEGEFKQGNVSADSYLAQRKSLINQEYDAVKAGYDLQLVAAAKNDKEKERISEEEAQAEMDRQKELTKIIISEDAVRLQYLQQKYQQSTRPLQTQVRIAQGDVTGRSTGLATSGTEQLLGLAQQHLNSLMQQTPDIGSDAWNKLQDEVEKTVLEIQTLNQELIRMKDIGVPLSGIFGHISGLAGTFRGPRAAGVSELFGSMQSSSQDISRFSQFNQAIKVNEQKNRAQYGTGPTNIISGLTQSFGDLFKKVKDVNGNLESMPDKLKVFADNLGAVISGVQGLIKGVTGGKTAAGGALSGGMAGAQMGSVAGPWGTLIGGIGGALTGALFGAKENKLLQDIHKIESQMNSIISDMQAGTISLSQAISDLRAERQQAIAMLSSDKKGGKGGKGGLTPSQAQGVIQEIDTQIQQLVNEQTQILGNLHTSLMELSQPIQFQDYLQSLDQIIQKYQQFASAAQGNTQQVAAANQYLNDSLQQYVTTLSQDLNQAQQTAIQDALTLINLEYQRQQLINQEAQQEYDVLTQGVLVRQRTSAMTKGQEIGVLRYQRDMQLEQMNEEIALQQTKVDAETKIFGLATTRIGLETQLLEAQQEQANYQILQVQALAQVLGALQGGLSGGQLMQTITGLMGQGALPTESGIMMTLLEELGLAGNVPAIATTGVGGVTNWLAGIPAQYASAAQYVASLDPNFINMILAGQNQQAAQDAAQYQSQGKVEGYDMAGLISWLTGTGTQGQGNMTNPLPGGIGVGIPGLPTYDDGGPVTRTGPINAHAGEFVLSNPMIDAFNGLMNIASPSASSPVDTSSSLQLKTHQSLYDITAQRTALEMNVISARQTQIQMEMQLMDSLNDTMANMSSGSGTNFEAALQKVYETRGRYGSANFRRETL